MRALKPVFKRVELFTRHRRGRVSFGGLCVLRSGSRFCLFLSGLVDGLRLVLFGFRPCLALSGLFGRRAVCLDC